MQLLSGNEAIAQGVWEAGCAVGSGYPGTPSTEALENLVKKDGVYCEWAPNEKVGLEVALGAAMGGVRAFAAMKHVGLNVAADPFMSRSRPAPPSRSPRCRRPPRSRLRPSPTCKGGGAAA